MENSIIPSRESQNLFEIEAPVPPKQSKVKFSRIGREKDIIIKCPLKEMVKRFFKNYMVIWHDPDPNSQENQQYVVHFVERFCKIKTFTEWDKALIQIRKTKRVCHVITSGTNGELLAREIDLNKNVSNIYVFCRDKDLHTAWSKNYPKIACVETNVSDVLDKIQEKLLEWYKKESSLQLNLPAFAPIFNNTHKSQMNNLHRFLKVIPKFKNRNQAKNDFIRLSREIYSNPKTAKLITDFEKNYNYYSRESIFKWYTLESFLYKVTNNCLRIATCNSIQYCRLPLREIQRAIKEQYLLKSKDFNGLLYRGASLSEEEWSTLKGNLGQEIEMHGFLSTSKEKNIALNYMEFDSSQKVFITIIVSKGPNEEEQGFAEVEEFSRFPKEKEVLFNVRSRFTVLETEEKYSEDRPYRHLVLLYGTQGFRRFLAEKDPFQEVSIPPNISCTYCKAPSSQVTQKMLFISLTDLGNGHYYCKKCLPNLSEQNAASLLCVSVAKNLNKTCKIKIKGCLLANMESQIPFYGYQCVVCGARKKSSYFACTNCDKEWCEDCWKGSLGCLSFGHTLIFESRPFSFWSEQMSKNELNHLKIQNDSVFGSHPFQQAEMYVQCHEYEKAIRYYNTYLKNNEGKARNENTENCYSNLGNLYCNQGEGKKAFESHLEALKITVMRNGMNSARAAVSFHNIATLCQNQREYRKALEYNFKSLEIRESIYGATHPDVTLSHHNIADVYVCLGEYQKALEHTFKSLEIRKSHYGDNHPDIAASYHNIACVYANQKEYEKALKYHLKALGIRRSVYGDNHPDVAASYSSMGDMYFKQEKFDTALQYCFKGLKIRKLIYGDNHPGVAASSENIGMIYEKSKEYEKAHEYYLKCLYINKSIYEDNHPILITTYHKIARILQFQEQNEKAVECYRKSLEIKQNKPCTRADAYSSLASLYQKQGKPLEALKYFFKALEIQKSIHGNDSSLISRIHNEILAIYQDLPGEAVAMKFHSKCLKIRKLVYGGLHVAVANSYQKIAAADFNQKIGTADFEVKAGSLW